MFGKIFGYLIKGDFVSLKKAVRQRIPRKFYYKNKAYIFKIDKQQWAEKRLTFSYPENYKSRKFNDTDLENATNFTGHTIESYREKLDASNIAFGVLENDRPVNINWVAFGDCYVRGMGYTHKAETNDAYIYGIVTDPNQRGKGLYKNCLIDLGDYLFNGKSENVYQLVEYDNVPVLKTLPKLGYEKIIEMSYKIIFGVKFLKVYDLAAGKSESKTFISEPKDYLII